MWKMGIQVFPVSEGRAASSVAVRLLLPFHFAAAISGMNTMPKCRFAQRDCSLLCSDKDFSRPWLNTFCIVKARYWLFFMMPID